MTAEGTIGGEDRAQPSPNTVRVGLLIDTSCILVFVAIGRGAHADGITIRGMASTSWPFLAAVVCGWLWCHVSTRRGDSVSGGVTVVVTTVVAGMGLRVAAGQGTAAAFVLVAFGFLGLEMLGWRLLWRQRGRMGSAVLAGRERFRPQ
jgi:hypothetical protein